MSALNFVAPAVPATILHRILALAASLAFGVASGLLARRLAPQAAPVAAAALGCPEEQMLVCSTGVIGRLLPMDVVEPGIRAAADRLEPGETRGFQREAGHRRRIRMRRR